MASTVALQNREEMLALVQEGSGSADVLHLRSRPVPVPEGDRLLVRVRAASVNALDWHSVHMGGLVKVISRFLGGPLQPVRGADLAGVVEAVGPDVTAFKPGDEVFGAGVGSFAEYALARQISLALKPAELSFEAAAALPVAGVTALQGLRDQAKVEPGQRVLVFGAAGGVGTFAVQIAKALGAKVTAVTHTRSLELVRSLGADEVIDYTQTDVTRLDDRYDVVFDVAVIRSLAAMRRTLKAGGIYVLVGAAKGGSLAIALRLLGVMVRSRLLRQRLAFFLAVINAADLEALAGLAGSGKLRPVIEARYPLENAAEAVRLVGTGTARGKVVVTIP
jgi:NADPH:quinone reductase-like Zn-dependent oxidoreductase